MEIGDTVLLHSDLSQLAHLGWKGGAEALLNAILEQIGPRGTLLAPTFTYSFCRGGPFDPASTPGEVGLFGNYLLSLEESVRSSHPIFSFAIIGEGKDALCAGLSDSAFGPGSIFERLVEQSATIAIFDTSFQACTAVHYTEQRMGVDYRYLKRFTVEDQTCEFYVRDLGRGVTTDLRPLERVLREEGTLSETSLLGRPLSCVKAPTLDQTIEQCLAKEPYFLCSLQPS